MQNIIKQVYDILHEQEPHLQENSYCYSSDVLDTLNNLLPEYIDEDRKVLKNAIAYALQLTQDDTIYIADGLLCIESKTTLNSDIVACSSDNEVVPKNDTEQLEQRKIETQSEEFQSNSLMMSLYDVMLEIEESGNPLTQELKEKIRNYLRKRDGLYEKDLILFLNDQIIVKHFNKQLTQSQEEQRYNGLPPEELNVFRAKIFPTKESEEKFIAGVMRKAMATDLNFSHISGANFQKIYLKRIQKHLHNEVAKKTNEDQFVCDGLGNLMLRENWNYAHKLMAKKILDLLSDSNSGVDAFLKYYKGETILGEDGLKYRQPEIVDDQDRKWTTSMMLGMVLQNRKNISRIQQYDQDITNIQGKILELKEKIAKIRSDKIGADGYISEIDQELAILIRQDDSRNAIIKELMAHIKMSDDLNARKVLNEELREHNSQTKKAIFKEHNLKAKKKSYEDIKRTADSKVERVKEDMSKYEKFIRDEEAKKKKFIESLQQFNEKYFVMSDALALALMKRKLKPLESEDKNKNA